MSTQAAIALGSNLGDRRATLDQAVLMMDSHAEISVRTVSSFIETDPVGPEGQDAYLNGAVLVDTTLDPRDLLTVLNAIEAQLGRDRSTEQRWGSRTCDLDILLYGDRVVDDPELTIPHPRMREREFVLGPLAEIAPDAIDPVSKKTVSELLADLEKTL